jgi:hypothetical protein
MSHVKTTFPAGWYSFCITQVDATEDLLFTLTFTCDTGERSYQHIKSTFQVGIQTHLIEKMNTRADFKVFGAMDQFYVLQYLGQRCEAKVDTIVKLANNATFITNVIVDWKPPVVDPDWNVMKPKSDDMFYKTKNKKKLPI